MARAYRENDALGGYDRYGVSKGYAELSTSCWRSSIFNPDDYGKTHQALLASARAGNVIAGGDCAADRLVPDIMRDVHQNGKVKNRHRQGTKPWQNVLEPLNGYLLLGQKLLGGQKNICRSMGLWTF